MSFLFRRFQESRNSPKILCKGSSCLRDPLSSLHLLQTAQPLSLPYNEPTLRAFSRPLAIPGEGLAALPGDLLVLRQPAGGWLLGFIRGLGSQACQAYGFRASRSIMLSSWMCKVFGAEGSQELCQALTFSLGGCRSGSTRNVSKGFEIKGRD